MYKNRKVDYVKVLITIVFLLLAGLMIGLRGINSFFLFAGIIFTFVGFVAFVFALFELFEAFSGYSPVFSNKETLLSLVFAILTLIAGIILVAINVSIIFPLGIYMMIIGVIVFFVSICFM